MANTKVKVRVADLIKRVKEVKAADEVRFANQSGEYIAALEIWEAAADEVVDVIESVASMDYEDGWGRGAYLRLPVPRKPREPDPVDPRHEKTLRMLEMVADDQVSLTLESDLAIYL